MTSTLRGGKGKRSPQSGLRLLPRLLLFVQWVVFRLALHSGEANCNHHNPSLPTAGRVHFFSVVGSGPRLQTSCTHGWPPRRLHCPYPAKHKGELKAILSTKVLGARRIQVLTTVVLPGRGGGYLIRTATRHGAAKRCLQELGEVLGVLLIGRHCGVDVANRFLLGVRVVQV